MEQIRVALVGEKLDSWAELVSTEPDFDLCGYYENMERALEGLPGINADVVLMDLLLSKNMTGIDCLKRVRKYCTATNFMILTNIDDQHYIYEAFKAGANGYLLKSETVPFVINAIKEIHQGGSPISPDITRKVVGYFNGNLQNHIDYNLNEEEISILKLLKSGTSNKEIGMLFYKNEIPENIDFNHRMRLYENFENRIKQKVHKIYKKIDVSKRTQAIEILENLPSESYSDSLVNLISYMHNYAENLFKNVLDITFHLPLDQSIPAVELSEGKIQSVFSAFKATLSNILNCAGTSGVIISVLFENNKVILTVFDGGETAENTPPQDLYKCLEKYMKVANGKFLIKNNRIRGKEVVLEIPL